MSIHNEAATAEQTILTAAEKLFLEKGYTLTSTADIAREAGCNSALIHYYFRTKERLFISLFDSKFESFVASFFAIPMSDLTFEQKVKATITTHFDFIRANKCLPFLLLSEVTTNPERLLQMKQHQNTNVESVIAALQREIDCEVSSGRIRKITAVDLMITIGTLDISTFLVLPVLKQISGFDEQKFIDNRREEIIYTVMATLKNNDTNEPTKI
ncbi:MAG: TetR/AcrR family transcriptional regulator [Rikenellaceae bacterium]